MKSKILKFKEERMRKKVKLNNLIVIKRYNLDLPRVLHLNPQSIYNKLDEFKTFVKEEDVYLICMSESWEREV
jgi:hypothetical protein